MESDSLIGIYGASGFGREVLPIVRMHASNNANLVFIDDAKLEPLALNGCDVLTYQEFCLRPEQKKCVSVAIADSRIRGTLFERLYESSIPVMGVVASNALMMDDVEIGEGHILCPFVTITSNVQIGKGFHANIYSYVAHDCVIGDFVTFAPGVKCNGNVHIHNGAYIGTGAIIKQGTSLNPLIIGRNSIVGMGAVVTKSVPDNTVVVGNPARQLEKK